METTHINNILVIGDIHCNFKLLTTIYEKLKPCPDLIIQCGDFGVWPNKEISIDFNIPILFAPGNHENWDKLDKYKTGEIHKFPTKKGLVYYCSFGSTLTLKDGRTLLFVGKAESVDKHNRIMGRDWWQQETVNYKDMENLPDKKIDIVISHTCPNYFNKDLSKKIGSHIINFHRRDPTKFALDMIFDRYRPKLWYFGHYHCYYTSTFKDCKWICLNRIDDHTNGLSFTWLL